MPQTEPERNQSDRNNFGTEILEHYDRLHRLALRLARNRASAADLVQETYARALRHHHQFTAGNLYAWLSTILLNTFRTQYRDEQREPSTKDVKLMVLAQNVDTKPVFVDGVDSSYLREPEQSLMYREDLDRAISRLEPEFRHILLRTAVEGFPGKEVAQELNWPIGTVKSRMFYAKAELRDMLPDYRTLEGKLVLT